jgi:hypothetical protein
MEQMGLRRKEELIKVGIHSFSGSGLFCVCKSILFMFSFKNVSQNAKSFLSLVTSKNIITLCSENFLKPETQQDSCLYRVV